MNTSAGGGGREGEGRRGTVRSPRLSQEPTPTILGQRARVGRTSCPGSLRSVRTHSSTFLVFSCRPFPEGNKSLVRNSIIELFAEENIKVWQATMGLSASVLWHIVLDSTWCFQIARQSALCISVIVERDYPQFWFTTLNHNLRCHCVFDNNPPQARLLYEVV